MNTAIPSVTSAPTSPINRIHGWLTLQSIVVVLVSINRLGPFTLGYVAQNEFLRRVDLNNILALPLISVVAFYLLKKQIEYDSPKRDGRLHLALNLVFTVGIYLLGAGYGDHEVTNYLHPVFARLESRIPSAASSPSMTTNSRTGCFLLVSF